MHTKDFKIYNGFLKITRNVMHAWAMLENIINLFTSKFIHTYQYRQKQDQKLQRSSCLRSRSKCFLCSRRLKLLINYRSMPGSSQCSMLIDNSWYLHISLQLINFFLGFHIENVNLVCLPVGLFIHFQGPSRGIHNLNKISIIFKIQRNVSKFHNCLQLF